MRYPVVSVELKDGRQFPQVVALDGFFTKVRGYSNVPFTDKDELASVRVNHERWDLHHE